MVLGEDLEDLVSGELEILEDPAFPLPPVDDYDDLDSGGELDIPNDPAFPLSPVDDSDSEDSDQYHSTESDGTESGMSKLN